MTQKLSGFATEDIGKKENLSSKFLDVQTALQAVGKAGTGTLARELQDVDSTLSTRGLMQRKLFLMKMMLKNEQNSNKVMAQKIGEMDQAIHSNSAIIK